MTTLGFIGLGSVGKALAHAMARAGVPVVAVASRDPQKATEFSLELPDCKAMPTQAVVDRAGIVFLTVPDDQIRPVCDSLRWRPGAAAVHCSGALPAAVLDSARSAGAAIGSCHPLQILTGADGDADLLAGSWFGIQADEPLRSEFAHLVAAIGGRPMVIGSDSGEKALYHASAVFAAGMLVTLVGAAAGLWEEFGHTREEGLSALLPLVSGAVEQLRERGLPAALSGPVARGDGGTVEEHLAALRAKKPELIPVYRELSLLSVELSRELGKADPAALDRIHELLKATSSWPADGMY